MYQNKKLAVIIPCYSCKSHIKNVITTLPKIVDKVLVIDDKCPENTGKFVNNSQFDHEVEVIFNQENLGVGGAVKAGYQKLLQSDFNIIIKVDGDEQMNPLHIEAFCEKLLNDNVDYVKGNRFFHGYPIREMPLVRLCGNIALSWINKFVVGNFRLSDPTNGYTAIKREVLLNLNFDRVANDYFFESDILFHIHMMRRKVRGIPVDTIYQGEKSHLSELGVIPSFLYRHMRNFLTKRKWKKYYEKNRNINS